MVHSLAMPKTTVSRFKQSLFDREHFTLTFELIPGRGGRSREQERIVSLARKLARDGRLQAVSITENAGGHPALSPEVLGMEIKRLGLDVITHFSCKDKNRNQMESLLFSWDRQGLQNLLVITGDYPKRGFQGYPKPVFDLDSVQVLHLLSRMNAGRFCGGIKQTGPDHPFQPTGFLKGVAVSPFKLTEAEQFLQYAKLQRKIAAGADYIITQLGYDARKFHELLLYLREHGLRQPVLGNVFVPNLTVARLMHEGDIPGCVLPDSLYRLIKEEAQAPDRGKRARLERAAKLLAVLQGMGYDGAHLGGPGLTYEDVDFVLSRAERYADNWRELLPEFRHWPEDGFYLYARDPATGLNQARRAPLSPPRRWQPRYELAKLIHQLAFAEQGPLYDLTRGVCLALERTRLAGPLSTVEHVVKFLAFGCQNCGDCALADLLFLCPQYGCAKYLLNGPCGGSRDGWCEVYPGRRRCLYVRWYERAKKDGRLADLARGYVPPRNWALNNTSSWLNFFKGLDHHGSGPDRE